jgi:hypothetical protein
MNSGTTKANAAWDQLCDLTTELLPQFGSRPAAFKAASRLRPDLAAVAIDPCGQPVVQRAAKTVGIKLAGKPEDSPIVQAAVRLAALAHPA